MKKLLKLLLKYQLKLPTKSPKSGGFTLIELLVGIIISALVLLPLLGFMINLMETDRKEQAKTASEQEVQSALNYISRDLDQAIFIYDGFGLNEIRPDLPTNVTGGTPVLVFWKRNFLEDALPIKDRNAGECKPNGPGTNCDDGFVYSLVSYYLIQDPGCTDPAWSCTARIARYEFKDQLKDQNNPDRADPIIIRNNGFEVFNLSPRAANLANATLEQKMNAWPNQEEASARRVGSINNNSPQVLIDYIDQTIPPAGGLAAEICPPDPHPGMWPNGTEAPEAPYPHRQVPPVAAGAASQTSFYACVDSEKTTAQVFIRGNALARMRPRNSPSTYEKSASAYFPKANILVQGRGFLKDGSSNQ
ncbi:MAG: hormogonium polysaccharide secretion pseudopilin HpsC [Potamolinea sp.]